MAKPSIAMFLLMTIVIVASLLRFVSLEKSPPGFYIDEAAISAQVICLRQSGATLEGQSFPLFTQVLGGGYLTPAYLIPALAWTKLFGDSVSSFRSLAAGFSILFIFGSFVLGSRVWRALDAGLLCALAAAVSPWSFQFSRIAWDPAIAPALLVWSLAFLWGAFTSEKHRTLQAILSGFFISAAAYSYPPLRVQLTIMIPFALIGLFRRTEAADRRRALRTTLVIVATAALVSLPLIFKTLSGEIQGRFQMLSVFKTSFSSGVLAMLQNFILLLSPDFLIFHGDANLRHSTGHFGIWGWVDILAVSAAAGALVVIAVNRSNLKPSWFEIIFVVLGYLAGLLPAAMTWESNPHALRSIGALVFLSIGTGGGLSLLWRSSKKAQGAIVGLAFAFLVVFANAYFNEYPKTAAPWFDAEIFQIAQQLKSENQLADFDAELQKRGLHYDEMAQSYYQLAAGAVTCHAK